VDGQYQCESAKPVAIQMSASVPVNDDRVSVIVAAFQRAMDSVMKDMLVQIQ
jgi:ABC-type uncharacterized transport system auxiliary subunit